MNDLRQLAKEADEATDVNAILKDKLRGAILIAADALIRNLQDAKNSQALHASIRTCFELAIKMGVIDTSPSPDWAKDLARRIKEEAQV
jgi:hypothetical protein